MLSGISSAEVYKWVDNNGVTHYGSKKPPQKNASKMNIRNSSSDGQKTTQNLQSMDSSVMSALLKDHGDASVVNCSSAVNNAKSSIKEMSNVSNLYRYGGYTTKSKHTKLVSELQRINRKISMSECKNASGNTLGFYKCMTNQYNHIVGCGKKYSYGL